MYLGRVVVSNECEIGAKKYPTVLFATCGRHGVLAVRCATDATLIMLFVWSIGQTDADCVISSVRSVFTPAARRALPLGWLRNAMTRAINRITNT